MDNKTSEKEEYSMFTSKDIPKEILEYIEKNNIMINSSDKNLDQKMDYNDNFDHNDPNEHCEKKYELNRVHKRNYSCYSDNSMNVEIDHGDDYKIEDLEFFDNENNKSIDFKKEIHELENEDLDIKKNLGELKLKI